LINKIIVTDDLLRHRLHLLMIIKSNHPMITSNGTTKMTSPNARLSPSGEPAKTSETPPTAPANHHFLTEPPAPRRAHGFSFSWYGFNHDFLSSTVKKEREAARSAHVRVVYSGNSAFQIKAGEKPKSPENQGGKPEANTRPTKYQKTRAGRSARGSDLASKNHG